MRNETLHKNYSFDAAVASYRFVKFGSADGFVTSAAAAADKIIGSTGRLEVVTAGDRGDVVRAGIAEIEYGGTVAAGDLLTSDASGRAITAAPAAGANVRIGGVAEVAGVVGDIGSYLIAPGVMQG